MKILIIEDYVNKMKRIQAEVLSLQPDAEIVEARSYNSGLNNLMSHRFDYLLLDMSLPVFDITHEEDGYQVDPFSGRNILAEMKRKGITVKTIVITMFETFGEGADFMTLKELDKDLRAKYPEIYYASIYYNSSEVNWRESLKTILEK